MASLAIREAGRKRSAIAVACGATLNRGENKITGRIRPLRGVTVSARCLPPRVLVVWRYAMIEGPRWKVTRQLGDGRDDERD